MDHKWLKDELARPGRSQAACARAIGLEQSAMNRIVNGGRKILADEARAILEYLRATSNGAPFAPPLDGLAPLGVNYLPVLATVEAGAWREADEYSPRGEAEIPVVGGKMLAQGAFALLVQGSSMNELYPPGVHVIVEPWRGGPLPYGSRVAVKRTRSDGLTEYTLKELRRGPKGDELWPRSTDPKHRLPIPLADDGSITVELVGRVVASYRTE